MAKFKKGSPEAKAHMNALLAKARTPEAKAKAAATRARTKALKAAGIGGVGAAMAHAHASGELGRAIEAGRAKLARKSKVSMTSAFGGLPAAWSQPTVTHEEITGVVSAKPKKAAKKKPAKKPKKAGAKSGSAKKKTVARKTAPKRKAAKKSKAAPKKKASAKRAKASPKRKAAKKSKPKKAKKAAPKKKAPKKGKRKSAKRAHNHDHEHMVPPHMAVRTKGAKKCKSCHRWHTKSEDWSHAVHGPKSKPRLNKNKYSYRNSPRRTFAKPRSIWAFLGGD